jgi:hypothetical protein
MYVNGAYLKSCGLVFFACAQHAAMVGTASIACGLLPDENFKRRTWD